MKHLSLTLRLSAGLASLTSCLLFIALAVGLVPDRASPILQGRKSLCECVAVHTAWAVQRGDREMIAATLPEIVRRNPEVLSAAVRTAEGEVLATTGDHDTNWREGETADAGADRMEAPINLDNKRWGTVEFRFQSLNRSGVWTIVGDPRLWLVVYVTLAGFVVYAVYLRTTLRRLASAQSNATPKRVRAAFDTLAEGVLILDKNETIVLANEAFAKMLGQPSAALEGYSASELPWIQPQSGGGAGSFPWAHALAGEASQKGAVLSLQADIDHPQKLSVNSMPIVGNDGALRGALATFDDLTLVEKKNAHLRLLLRRLKHSRGEVRRQNEELKMLATRDPLTDCLNRRAFFTEFETHLDSATRYDHPLSCVMLDIDHFKSVNDRHGHGVGDQVLQQVAETLKSMVRKSDLVCRYGGEEFCILLPHVDLEGAFQAAERFRQGIESKNCANIGVTSSFGVSALRLGARDPRELLDQADKALYAAKRTGRNRVVRWDWMPADLSMNQEADRRTEPPQQPESPVAIPFHAVAALLSALGYRHQDTAEHSRRVADLCVAMANGLLSQGNCYVLEVAAQLHDIGKLGVPDAVLLKPGPLTDSEWKVIRTHERIGEEIIAAAFSSPLLTAIIRNHHCWYGGSPHAPELPTGDDIPLGARILAIADAFDAITSDRVYRQGRTREEAFAELRRCAGRQFDPELVERFIQVASARDDHRSRPVLTVSKQTALHIGLQIEKLANALDARDVPTLAAMAGRLNAAASKQGITPIADLAARIEQRSTAAAPNWIELLQCTVDLLELCRSTSSSYLPKHEAPDLAHAGAGLHPVSA